MNELTLPDGLIGTPFQWGGRGPDAYDCIGLVSYCFEYYRGIQIPSYYSPDNRDAVPSLILNAVQSDDWVKVQPQAGVGVAFKIKRWHVGFMISEYDFVHTWEKSGGVIIEGLHPDWANKVVGFYDYRP